jgi:hypothetical protein
MRIRAETLKGSAKRAKRGRNVRVWIAATAAASSIGLVAVAVSAPALLARWSGHLDAVTRAPDADRARAAALRAEASAACGRGLMDVCKARLDDARARDPGGEDTAEVRALRKTLDAAAPSKARGADGAGGGDD